MSFKILNIAVKCSRSFFLKSPIRPLLKQNLTRFCNFCAEYKILNTSADKGTLYDT